jgi:transcriptional regulator with XRE-family HTH domain
MAKNTFVFTKEMADILSKIRKKAGLSQTEIAERIGLSSKSFAYISFLENGKIKNPSLGAILPYLRACGESWTEFFKELDIIDFKMRHEKMISQLPPPATQRKIQRDAMRYEIGVEFPSKEKEEIDFARLKKIIKDKVSTLVNKEEITLTPALSHSESAECTVHCGHRTSIGRGNIAAYQKFAMEYFDFFASLNKAGMKMTSDKYLRAGLQFNLISKIRKIITSVVGGEIKRIEAKKPLPTAKQERMAIGFTKYRIRMERIEAEVHRLLCELGVQSSMGRFALYKDFARECYGALKKYFGRNPELLNKTISEIIQRWLKQGLNEEILLKVREKTFSVYLNPTVKR